MTKVFLQIKKYLLNIFQASSQINKQDDFLDLMYKAAKYSNQEQMKVHRKAQEMVAG